MLGLDIGRFNLGLGMPTFTEVFSGCCDCKAPPSDRAGFVARLDGLDVDVWAKAAICHPDGGPRMQRQTPAWWSNATSGVATKRGRGWLGLV